MKTTLSSTPATLSPTLRAVRVALTDDVASVIATRAIDAGEVILHVEGLLVDHPSRYSVQIDDNLHIDLPASEVAVPDPERHPWRYLNHSCDPNAALARTSLVALRPIASSEQITFDYNTTEYEMSTPFACHCGACGGSMIRGFKFLTPQQQQGLYPRLAVYLRRNLDSSGSR